MGKLALDLNYGLGKLYVLVDFFGGELLDGLVTIKVLGLREKAILELRVDPAVVEEFRGILDLRQLVGLVFVVSKETLSES